MKILIHDMGSACDELFKEKCDTLISADGRYAPCRGCFGCWTKTPAACFMKDSLHEVCRMIGTADELVIVSENCYGSYSPAVKNILDRSIGVSTPFSTYRGGQMHHTLRYGKHTMLRVIAYGDMTPAEAETFKALTARNMINMGYESWVFEHIDSMEKVREVL